MRTPLGLSTLTLVLCAGAQGIALAQQADAPPSTPPDVSAIAYSGTAGAVRWQRSTDDRGAVPGYEVSRDGVVLGTFDALSYVERDLAPGRTYAYRVVAIDGAGQRSSPASVRLTTPGGADEPPAPETETAPANLRAEVYSRRSLELFWDRPAPGIETRYEIRRDGEPVAIKVGTSFYETGLEAGREYRYEVLRLPTTGPRSAVAVVDVRTDGGGEPPAPGLEAAPANLRAEVYSRRSLELFWDRPAPGVETRYEIRRDGEPVAIKVGTSFYETGLEAGREYRYEVIRVPNTGPRSAVAVVDARTDGGGGPSMPGGGPAAPDGLRAERYSARNGELFWTRPAMPGLRYEISRDGAVLATTNGVSYYDDTLTASRVYEYAVVAIDSSGRRSAASDTTLGDDGRASSSSSAPRLVSVDPVTGAETDARVGFPNGPVDAALSDDGRYVFYSLRQFAEEGVGPQNGIYRYRLADGDVELVAANESRNLLLSLRAVSDDGDTLLLNGGEGEFTARAGEGFAGRFILPDAPGLRRPFSPIMSDDGSTLAFSEDGTGYLYDVESGALTVISGEPLSSPVFADDADDWQLFSPRGISDDARTAVFSGTPPGESTGTFVYDRASATTRVFGTFSFQLECASCPPENGTSVALSGDGRTLVYGFVPESRRDVRDPERDLLVADLEDGSNEVISDSRGASGLSIDDAGSVLVWRDAVTRTLLNLDTRERVTLTDSGYGECNVRGVCFGGDSEEVLARVSADGSTAVFVERVNVDGGDGSVFEDRLRVYDVASDTFSTVLDNDDARSVDPLPVKRLDVSADGSVIVIETVFRSAGEEGRRVVLAIER